MDSKDRNQSLKMPLLESLTSVCVCCAVPGPVAFGDCDAGPEQRRLCHGYVCGAYVGGPRHVQQLRQKRQVTTHPPSDAGFRRVWREGGLPDACLLCVYVYVWCRVWDFGDAAVADNRGHTMSAAFMTNKGADTASQVCTPQ